MKKNTKFLTECLFLSACVTVITLILVKGLNIHGPLGLVAIIAVLFAGDIFFQVLYTFIFYRGKKDSLTLHCGQLFFTVLIGTLLAIWWAWKSTLILLFLDGTWQILAAFLDRTSLENSQPEETTSQDDRNSDS